jgi:type III pantothenate kinase
MHADRIPSVLACDVGNTHVRIAHVESEDVSDVQAFRLGDLGDLGRAVAILWERMPDPKRVVASSVNPSGLRALEAAITEAIDQETLAVGRDLALPLTTTIDNPQAIGVDRMCTAVAAFDRLGMACIVADFGSATTIDCIDDKGNFLGGAILPGLKMGARTLGKETAQLPEVKLRQPDWVFGRNTEDAICGGLVLGTRGALRYFVESYATELGHWPVVIATGGDAELVCGDIHEDELVQAIVPDLALRGVALAYYRCLLK